jgi:arginyl-tRNA synthetase
MQQKGMMEAYKLLEEKKLLVDSDNAQIIDLEEYKLGKTVVRNNLGATLYITRDISAAKSRWEKYYFTNLLCESNLSSDSLRYHFDKMIYVVAAPQNLHFQQLFKILELMGYEWANKCLHVNFGLVKLPRVLRAHFVVGFPFST